jgi:hypothetical protein
MYRGSCRTKAGFGKMTLDPAAIALGQLMLAYGGRKAAAEARP